MFNRVITETVTIRRERICDFDEIRTVVKTAFAGAEHTDGDEHNLINRLRCTEEYIPELSLVAEIKGMMDNISVFPVSSSFLHIVK